MQMTSTAAGRLAGTGSRLSRLSALARQHWLLSLLLLAGLILRIIVQITYRPALFYIDSIKYLFGAYAGNDPPGYQFVLKALLPIMNVDTVAALQHVLGLGMAVAIYALLLRRGVARWLAALAVAPVLLDAYQLQLEATIMPDVLFEALLVAGFVVLLWRSQPRLWQIILAGLLLGTTAPMWEPGEILILPAVVLVLCFVPGWRRKVSMALVMVVAFAAPIALVSYHNKLTLHKFSLAPYATSTIYGRMAYAADCATLKLPTYMKPLCPPRAEALALGPDNLDHNIASPLKHLVLPPGMTQHQMATTFAKKVVEQQPLRVVKSWLSDSIKLFEVHRVTSAGDTPISRWQFQNHYPTFAPYVTIVNGALRFGIQNSKTGQPEPLHTHHTHLGGGDPTVIKPLAKFLRGYQLNGGYTPGPLLLLSLLLGLVGAAFIFRRRRNTSQQARDAAWACFFILGSGMAVLLLSDLFEFSWRYQLPAVVTLPPAGALGLSLIIGYIKSRRSGPAELSPDTPSADTTAPAQTPAEATTEPQAKAPAEPKAETKADAQATASAEPVAAEDETADGSLQEADSPNGESVEDREPQGQGHASAG
jgi:hypothetical protein